MERYSVELRNVAGVRVGFPERVTASHPRVAVREFLRGGAVASNLRSCVRGGGATIIVRPSELMATPALQAGTLR